MKKTFIILTLMLFFMFSNTAFGGYEIKGGAQTKRVPRGTRIELKMAEPLTTENITAGDMFSAKVVKDIVVDSKVVLPAGSLIRGNVKEIRCAKRLSKSAILYLTFDHVVTPSGRQVPIKAGICSQFDLTDEGGITGGGNYGWAVAQNWHKGVDMVKKSTAWGVKSGKDLFTGGEFLVTPIAAVGGAIGGGFYFVGDSVIDLFRKGNEVVINQGQDFDILLLDNLDVPVW